MLRRGLYDATAGVRLNAAYGLAQRGYGAGRHLLERSLSREGLADLGVPEAFRPQALTNALGAALVLRDATLRPLVERLAGSDEPDGAVRAAARTALARWDGAAPAPEAPPTEEVRDVR